MVKKKGKRHKNRKKDDDDNNTVVGENEVEKERSKRIWFTYRKSKII